jgi:cytochrome d ubiquinol oxidase subunit I
MLAAIWSTCASLCVRGLRSYGRSRSIGQSSIRSASATSPPPWLGNFLRWRDRLETTRWFLWATFLAFPSGFIAIVTGWYTAEVGRQPWVVYGLLRTADAHTPTLKASDVWTTLIGYVAVYAVIYSFGLYYIYRLLRAGPTRDEAEITHATAMRPTAVAGSAATATGSAAPAGQ